MHCLQMNHNFGSKLSSGQLQREAQSVIQITVHELKINQMLRRTVLLGTNTRHRILMSPSKGTLCKVISSTLVDIFKVSTAMGFKELLLRLTVTGN